MKNWFFLIIILISLVFYSCHKDFKFQDIDYKTYNRVVGPKGGIVNFYANYANDSKNGVFATLNIPAGAIDSMMVFNIYQFEDFELTSQMGDGFAKFGSKVLYFVPFYESDGYHARGQFELNYHLGVNFKQPVTVIYHPLVEDTSSIISQNWQQVELSNNYYKSTNKSYKVYRIKIPKLDQWGSANNIFVNWTYQGYPNGYDATDISYIVSGRWSSTYLWGTGPISMENWELVSDYTINAAQNTITFKIDNTDYFYVVAKDIYLKTSNVPFSIRNYINLNFLPDTAVARASYDQTNYKLYLSNNSVATFDNNQTFQYRLTDNLTNQQFPRTALSYIPKYYPGLQIKKLSSIQDTAGTKYEALLSSGIKLDFNTNGGLIGLFQYNFNSANLPVQARTYIQTNFPKQIINNVTYDSTTTVNYIAYLSSGLKVYFNGNGAWTETYNSNLTSDKLPANILSYFTANYPKGIFSQIDRTIFPKSDYIDIYLVDNKSFRFTYSGTLLQYKFQNLSENSLPPAITAYLVDPKHELLSQVITNINHIYSSPGVTVAAGEDYYEIYFANMFFIKLSPSGVLLQ
jgi:hypothetical protein